MKQSDIEYKSIWSSQSWYWNCLLGREYASGGNYNLVSFKCSEALQWLLASQSLSLVCVFLLLISSSVSLSPVFCQSSLSFCICPVFALSLPLSVCISKAMSRMTLALTGKKNGAPSFMFAFGTLWVAALVFQQKNRWKNQACFFH